MAKNVTRLYEQFQPEQYRLELDVDAENLTFKGTVAIIGKKVGRPSERLTFHQKGLKITDASIHKNNAKNPDAEADKIEIERINTQNSLDEVRLHTKETLYPGNYWVALEFEGKITDPMQGIYPCRFKHDGKDKMLVATQFESHHAREAFPCIDEPEAKATFDFALTTPKDATALSNTPIRNEMVEGDKKTTFFELTPKMSTYLLAFVFGEMGYKEGQTKDGVKVRCFATPDNVQHTGYSVDVAVNCLEFFGDYFDTKYPLEKLDMVALPDFASGAMENWGLVTYRETVMLYDEKNSGIESKQLSALVIAHELSHQWFGNLVTMKWWDDLWLNESFANMMEYRAPEKLNPEWKMWEQFVSHEGVMAKRRDSIVDIQSVHKEVKHPDEIGTLFDPSIVYAKGGTILYMLLNHIGEENFRNGLREYFKKHAYGNTVANDLWGALSDASGENIGEFMHKWLVSPGYPIVTVDWQPKSKEVNLTQKRFLNDPSIDNTDTAPWHVPLVSTHALSAKTLTTMSDTLKVEGGDGPFLLNDDGKSYFIPHYVNKAHLDEIIEGIRAGKVSTLNRFLLLDNYTMMQKGGVTSTTELLDLISAYENEESDTVWSAVAMGIAEAKKLIEGDEDCNAKLDAIIADLSVKLAEKLGWDDKPDDSAQTLKLRSSLISFAAGAKVQSFIDEGLKRFRNFEKPSDLSASTRGIVYYCGVRFGDDKDFAKLLEMYKSNQNAEEKDELAGGLTSARQENKINQLVDMLKQPEYIRRQDLLHWFVWLMRNHKSRPLAWKWMVDNWSWIADQYAGDKSYSAFARYSGNIFSTEAEQKQFNDFFEEKKEIIAMTRDITLAQQEIAARVAWRARNEAAVKAWLVSH